MITLTSDQIQKLQEYAAALMHVTEISILLDIPPEDQTAFEVICLNDRNSPLYRAFHTGRLQTKLELRRNIIKLAKAGSPAAEPIALKFINEQLIDK
jgi:hypothetical protein